MTINKNEQIKQEWPVCGPLPHVSKAFFSKMKYNKNLNKASRTDVYLEMSMSRQCQ